MNDDENDRAARLMADIFGRAWAADRPKDIATTEPGNPAEPKPASGGLIPQSDAPMTASFVRGSRVVNP